MKPCKKKKREQKSQATSVPAVGLVFILVGQVREKTKHWRGLLEGKNLSLLEKAQDKDACNLSFKSDCGKEGFSFFCFVGLCTRTASELFIFEIFE